MSIVFPVLAVSVIFLFAAAVAVCVGVYVYRDAKRRGMNALLWTVVAVLAPSLIGFIIYLLARGNRSDLKCPQCASPVTERFVLCPQCGAKLRAACPNCAAPVEPGWKVCPICTRPLPEQQPDVRPPVRPADRSIGKVMAVAIIVPVLLVVLLLLGMSASFAGGSSSWREDSLAEYHEEIDSPEVAERVQAWLDGLSEDDGSAHALRYEHSSETGKQHFFLVYVPGTGYRNGSGLSQSNSIFGTALTLSLRSGGGTDMLYCVLSSADSQPELRIKLDGKHVPCHVTDVDYNPTLYIIVPQYDEVEPGAAEFFLPERLSVVKIVGNHNEGVAEVTDEDLKLDILAGIDSAPYLDLEDDIYRKADGSGGYDFKDGFEIVVEYRVRDGLVLHEDMLHCIAMEQNGKYYLIDDRPDNGRMIRQTDEEFYNKLSALFEK